jgi:N-acetylglucosaminyl-diphospho-decaprenol L-rhamnosyltransferase
MDVSILIVSFNTVDETLTCLASVFEQTRQAKFEVIVVDNASCDGSAAAIARRFPQVRLLALPNNVGFAAATNRAAREASGRHVLLLNPDTVVLDGAIDRLLCFADAEPRSRIYGGRTFFADMTLNRNSCHGEPTPWSLFCIGLGLSSLFRHSSTFNSEKLGNWQRDTVRSVDCITGCFLLVKRDTWNELGGFDSSFFMYGEDTDFCIRARKAGYPCVIYPDAKIIHHGGRSERVRADKMVRLFRAKHQLFVKHWDSRRVPFGSFMLRGWALSRWMITQMLGFASNHYEKSARQWHEVWRRRNEFSSHKEDSTNTIALPE